MSSLRRKVPMKRARIRHRPRRNRVLTAEQWRALNERVERMDREIVIEFAEKSGWVPIYLIPGKPPIVTTPETRQVEMCPAVVMDPSELGNCYGAWRRDHVKEEIRIGVKADDDIWHLVSLCAGHDERGAKAGRIWNTAHREEENVYLRNRRPRRDGVGGEDVP